MKSRSGDSRRTPAPLPDVGGERWFRHTVHSLKPWAPELAAQFIAVMEAGRRLHDRASYFAVLADLLAEASHWQAAGLRPERSTIQTRRDGENA